MRPCAYSAHRNRKKARDFDPQQAKQRLPGPDYSRAGMRGHGAGNRSPTRKRGKVPILSLRFGPALAVNNPG